MYYWAFYKSEGYEWFLDMPLEHILILCVSFLPSGTWILFSFIFDLSQQPASMPPHVQEIGVHVKQSKAVKHNCIFKAQL